MIWTYNFGSVQPSDGRSVVSYFIGSYREEGLMFSSAGLMRSVEPANDQRGG